MQRLAMRWRSAIILPFLLLGLLAGGAAAQDAAAVAAVARMRMIRRNLACACLNSTSLIEWLRDFVTEFAGTPRNRIAPRTERGSRSSRMW